MGIVQTVPVEQTCGQCLRVEFDDGLVLVVEAAISPDHTSEVVGQLAALRDSRNVKRRQRHADLVDRFEQLSAYGKLEVPLEMRELEGELWEIKTAEDRVPFRWFDVSPTHKRAVRLTHQFAKATGKTQWGTTPRKHIDRGLWIVKGDKTHA